MSARRRRRRHRRREWTKELEKEETTMVSVDDAEWTEKEEEVAVGQGVKCWSTGRSGSW